MKKFVHMLEYARLVPRLGVGNVLAIMRHHRRLEQGLLPTLLPTKTIVRPRPL